MDSSSQHLRVFRDSPLPSCELAVEGWGYAQVPHAEIAASRKHLPTWASPDTPNNFFKYADEQTLLAVRAVDDALQRTGLQPSELTTWSVIGAPQFLGRAATLQAVSVFQQRGGASVSPHVVPQSSLHSVSGALSILLATHGANVGLGGGHDALVQGLMAATSLFDLHETSGCWVVATGWDPEPLPSLTGEAPSEGIGHAVALALRPVEQGHCGRLALVNRSMPTVAEPRSINLPELIAQLRQLDATGSPRTCTWHLTWGADLQLELKSKASVLRRAA